MSFKKLGLYGIIAIFTLGKNLIYSRPAIKAVVYDLHGVLSKIDNFGVAGEIGFMDAVFYQLFDAAKYGGIESKLLQTIETIGGSQEPHDGHVVCNGHLKPLPQLMCRWMNGSFDPAAEKVSIMSELRRLYCAGFFKNKREYRVIRNLITYMFFEPHRLNKHKKPIKEMFEIAHDVKCKGRCRQFLLSNIDALGFADLLKSKMGRELLKVIKRDDLIASAHIGYNKPHPNAYLHIIRLHGYKPEECVFIDDQRENVQAARELGMIGLHVKDKNYKKIRRELERLGVV